MSLPVATPEHFLSLPFTAPSVLHSVRLIRCAAGFNCLCVPTGVTQSIIRDGYNIEVPALHHAACCGRLVNCFQGGCVGDALATVCCCIQPCAVTRMLREVKTRGPCSSKTTITATGQLVRVCDNVKTRPWSSGLFSCHQNCGHCLNSFCCPCCAIATARTAYDDSSWAFNCCCLGPCATRNIIREGKVSKLWTENGCSTNSLCCMQFNIEGDCLGDMCVGCCCVCCSSAQLLRELDHRKANKAEIQRPGVVATGQKKSSQKAPSKKSSRRGSGTVS